MGFGITIAKRGVRLGKLYVIIAILLSIYGIGLSNVPKLIPSSTTLPSSVPDVGALIPIISIAIMSIIGLLISTPIELIFVYDKNNGVLEYLLSTGMDQMDIFTGYLKAALILSGSFLVAVNLVNLAVGLYLRADMQLLSVITVLTLLVGVSVVAFVTVAMIAFSSLQKTQLGSNQPLGIALGIVPIVPFFILPFAVPSLAIILGFVVAAVTVMVAIGFLLLSSKLIQRERLLP